MNKWSCLKEKALEKADEDVAGPLKMSSSRHGDGDTLLSQAEGRGGKVVGLKVLGHILGNFEDVLSQARN